MRRTVLALLVATACSLLPAAGAIAAPVDEAPVLAARVKDGSLPPMAERLPQTPNRVATPFAKDKAGKYGGRIYMLMGSAKDIRQVYVYGYARLVGYDRDLQIVPDILESVDSEDDRVFTLRLRKGHRWSDGRPFTSDDFRYWWEDVANNPDLSPSGPPVDLLVDGAAPTVTFPDATTVRYAWKSPNPAFLPALAGASPTIIYAPAHYLKPFHQRYADPAELAARVEAARQRNWQSLHNKVDNLYRMENPDLPTLQPWMNTTPAPAQRFVFVRNPYFHRADADGRQLPYVDEVIVNVAAPDLISAKSAAGDTDLQGRYLRFSDVPFLKQNEKQQNYEVRLWRTGKGSHIALYPNLNIEDPVWRQVFRDVRFRRALSLALNRQEVNKVLFYGLALPGNNTLLPESPLASDDLRNRWAIFDLAKANALLDEMGLKRGPDGIRRLPDGRALEIIVETAGESSEETDVLQLVHDSWLKAGIKLFSRPLQREVLRNRIFAGSTQMSVWSGLENGLATAAMSPAELAPTSQQQLQWPKWGQHHEAAGNAGEPIDMPQARELMDLYKSWRNAGSMAEKEKIWRRMLEIHADQVFNIGIVSGILQPIVVSNRLKNVPEKGFWNWDPGAHFGIYRPDTFWLTGSRDR
ncbi:peptide/nickel transport system substrate-binding protein [Constrictibacter sp. MBR-5]|uniref:ABC transporter substrate-binding protein n=1 Tax=Constrictibacter sp. MBR-5 TaxID=3156467 RepID=UPI0033982145